MTLGGDVAVSQAADADGLGTFTLERFAWETPERLAVAGVFSGAGASHAQNAALVLRGQGEHRLPAVPDAGSGPAEDGRPWSAVFAWQEPPAPFEHAELQLGEGIVVDLPRLQDEGGPAVPVPLRATTTPAPAVAAEAPARRDGGPADDLERLSLDAELIAARAETRAARDALAEAKAALALAEEGLEAERRARAQEAEGFREALARFRDGVEGRLGEQEAAQERLAAQLAEARAAIAARDEGMTDTRAELERARADADAVEADAERMRAKIAQVRAIVADEP